MLLWGIVTIFKELTIELRRMNTKKLNSEIYHVSFN